MIYLNKEILNITWKVIINQVILDRHKVKLLNIYKTKGLTYLSIHLLIRINIITMLSKWGLKLINRLGYLKKWRILHKPM